ncbi:Transcriptional regulator containing an amidase domain and an AraC-type DNA-binding HTH domain [Fulvimarina pelagi HTCC2506]|uniref:Transcriptional regulator containing an amidase domain and an AraC-type DNA-binding HTH domain n=1 Tax=Fulvimarina pelagi HTCC2506 TaxID=314231 RepID=Q0G2Q9_9HYPH|nr:helix-turn-helix domain-containing protein [Fulvimarina pelagi]EAU42122.1 Transcriptional regulator containing an amidase domain and an AraC-type DNA-binding HTH domain [Fulvimarina pelagi HTCC2506]
MRNPGPEPIQVAIVALPDAVISTLAGVFDVLNGAAMMGIVTPGQTPIEVRIVGEKSGPLRLASGVPVEVQTSVDDVSECDIVIVPSILLAAGGWRRDRYPKLVTWAVRMHGRGARICSACSGLFLLAETGLFDGRDATVHFSYADAFSELYPEVAVHPERVLVISGCREELVSSGASNTWHDLVLYLIAHHVGATVALEVARLFALQWHQDGLTPYMVFEGQSNHGDAEIAGAQEWLKDNFSVGSPVEEMIRRSRLAERTFKRRFASATGLAPIAYVQRLRIEDAKRRLERTDSSVEDISWRVGYEEPAFFRRLFKRTTGMAPGAYRRRFQIPDFARSTTASGAADPNEPETTRPALTSVMPRG